MATDPDPAAPPLARPRPPIEVEARRGVDLAGDFTYRVLPVAAAPAGDDRERRGSARRRTRLRSGKIVARDGRFVTECLIYNRSAQGCLLRLPSLLALPATLLVYDDQADSLLQALVIWRKDRDVGVRFMPPSGEASRYRAISESMRRKFYSVRD